MALSVTLYSLPICKKDLVLIKSFKMSLLGLSTFLCSKPQQSMHNLPFEDTCFPHLGQV